MNKNHLISSANGAEQSYRQRLARRVWLGALLGLVCGCVFPLCGLLFLAVDWLTGRGGGWLYTIGSLLMLTTIPLLLLGAHCLDLLHDQQQARFRQRRHEPARAQDSSARNGHARTMTLGFAVLGLLSCGALIPARAQQTVFNVPTTDVLDKDKVYFELDISAKPNDSAAVPRFSSFVPRLVAGAGGRVEIGLNVAGNVQPGADTTTLVPAVKWKVYDGKSNGRAVALGNNLFIPVRNKAYDLGTYAYVMAQQTFKTNTRVGAGGYFFSKNVVAPDANRAGGQFTFEQPVTKKLNINADWFTGRHANGLFAFGVAYKLTNKLTGVAAYSIGNANASKGNHFLYFEVGYNFN